MERLTSFPEGREGARTILGPEALCLFAFVFVQLHKLLYCLWLICLRQIPKAGFTHSFLTVSRGGW